MTLLKSLELHGYKTFASRTPFEFPGMITAVVGPNGSGKSNIADSLRWVLGEQSYSVLRGRKTEDMIFSGSEQRTRAGMASATVVLNNENGWLPIDYSEVAITRRAYRDGTNEYLLNGQKVRLKEINELLAQSGLAERTYTIIGQGLVDAALSLKPEERRRFFEEAAGIGLYRARREESLNRLDTTRRNLERVLDILAELEPRLNSLERQARRAMEYEQVRADMRLLLRDWYGYHWNRSQVELQHSHEVAVVQEEAALKARERLRAADENAQAARARLAEVRQQLTAWHADSAALHSDWEKAGRALAVLEERKLALQDRQVSLDQDMENMLQQSRQQNEGLAGLREGMTTAENELREAKAQAGEVREALRERQNQRGGFEREIQDLRRKLVGQQTRQVQLRAHENELSSRLNSLQANLLGLEKTLGKDSGELEQSKTAENAALADKEISEKAREELEKTLQTLRGEQRSAEEKLRKLTEDLNRREGETARANAQLEVLRQAEQALSGMAEGGRFLIQESRKGRVKGAPSALATSISVSQELESALAAAMGDLLDVVVLGDDDDLEGMLNLLERSEKGRAQLFRKTSVPEEAKLRAGGETGLLGRADELVRTKDDLTSNAIRSLLGRTWIARDRAAALKIVPNLPYAGRIVTLAGEVFSENGLIAAGKESRQSASAAALSRTRRIAEQSQALEGLHAVLSKVREEHVRQSSGVESLRKDVQKTEELARQANRTVSRAAQAYQQAQLRWEQIQQRHAYQERQSASLQEQIRASRKELQATRDQIGELDGQIRILDEQLRAKNRELSSLPLDELQHQLVHWNTSVAVGERGLKESMDRLQALEKALQGTVNQLEALRRRKNETDQSLTQLAEERVQLSQEESGLNARLEELRKQIQPAESEMLLREEESGKMQDNQVAAQQALTLAERQLSQAQIEQNRNRETLESLKRKVEEDFGLVAFEYIEEPGQAPLPLEGMVEQLPKLVELPNDLEENIARHRGMLRRMGMINPEVQNEYKSVKERFDFLNAQMADLKQADEDLRLVIAELDELMKREFRRTFDEVAREFKTFFTRLFGGGTAKLVLTDAESTAEMGIDIEARLPGRRDQGLSLLSGGERSLTAVALIFALLKVSPTPFCVMDEVDAMLDEANVGRFRDMLEELAQKTQFVLITHNRNTVQVADVIYGVTMGRDSASQVISLRLDELSEEMVK